MTKTKEVKFCASCGRRLVLHQLNTFDPTTGERETTKVCPTYQAGHHNVSLAEKQSSEGEPMLNNCRHEFNWNLIDALLMRNKKMQTCVKCKHIFPITESYYGW